MRRYNPLIAFLAVLLLLSILTSIVGCTSSIKSKDLMDGITPKKVTEIEDFTDGNTALRDFSVRLFKECAEDGKSTLLSPLSVFCALSMVANGAEGETLTEMESVLGMTRDELNLYLANYISSLPEEEKCKLSLANSIWFKDDDLFTVNEDFLQTNADYFGAGIYKTPFDRTTLNDITSWVKKNTDGMIPKVLKEIPDEAIMYLINTIAFDAEWLSIYEDYQVRDGIFTREDGKKEDVELMYTTLSRYLEDDLATGFFNYYSGCKYAFVALLPNEGVSVSEYIESLDGEHIGELLSSRNYHTVKTAIPKFEVEYTVELPEVLKNMGMNTAFDVYNANFSSLGEYVDKNIYIGNVTHKTYIEVGERGTRAGAVTVIEMDAGNASPQPDEIKEVYLDRPFVYMLVDCQNNVPFFIGTVMSVNN